MVARIKTISFQGVEVLEIDVQVQISNGMPSFAIVGLADKTVGESKERIRSALSAIGLALPSKRITVNLAPADVQKEGSHYDLPIALGILVCQNVIAQDDLDEFVVVGELALDGQISAVSGVLPAAIHASSLGCGIICPAPCGKEAAWAGEDVQILAPTTIPALVNHFKGRQILTRPEVNEESDDHHWPDFKDIKGQETAKRAIEIAIAGGHNLLMFGPPGTGKSMLASRIPSILPPLSPREALEVSMIHSLAGTLENGQLMRHRPFREPHHSATLPALIGGGHKASPGEVSLAHRGVLFLDELAEFSRGTLEAMRQPIESGRAVIARANHHVTYPADFQLIAAMNPCRCGYLGDPDRACSRAPKCALDYQAKISGPLMDRFDLFLDVPIVKAEDLSLPPPKEGSEEMRARIFKARDLQGERLVEENAPKHMICNADLDGEWLEKIAALDEAGKTLLLEAANKMKLSGRGYHRVLRVARTIGDLDQSAVIKPHHIAEALTYRRILGQALAA